MDEILKFLGEHSEVIAAVLGSVAAIFIALGTATGNKILSWIGKGLDFVKRFLPKKKATPSPDVEDDGDLMVPREDTRGGDSFREDAR